MIIINAEIRNGNIKNNKLRILNKIPAIIYGKNISPIKILINYNEMNFLKNSENLLNNINININNDKLVTIIKDIQNHPFKNKIIHIDFLVI